jgi:hypothetical protein
MKDYKLIGQQEREKYGLPKLELPLPPESTPEEIEQRHRTIDAILALREQIGLVDITLRELFGDDDEFDDKDDDS